METNIQFWHELLGFLEEKHEYAKEQRDYNANRYEDLKAVEDDRANMRDYYDKEALRYSREASLIEYFILTIGRKEA